MGNCRAQSGLGHTIVNLRDDKDVYQALYNLISMDGDLVDNEDYFRDDTIELGFDDEAERCVKEELKQLDKPITPKSFETIAENVFSEISNQEYYGICDLSVRQVTRNEVSLAYSWGGDYGN